MEKKKVKSIVVFGYATFANPDQRYVVGASLVWGGSYVKLFDDRSQSILSDTRETKERSQVYNTRESGRKTSNVFEKSIRCLSKAEVRGPRVIFFFFFKQKTAYEI